MKKGFTLLELMIVVIIVGILASLAMPRFINAANKAREAEAKNMLGAIRSSQLRYYLENNAYTDVVGELDITIDPNPSTYYTYTSDPGTGTGVVGTATKTAGYTALTDYTITYAGEISP